MMNPRSIGLEMKPIEIIEHIYFESGNSNNLTRYREW
jgi:hypothetical protein